MATLAEPKADTDDAFREEVRDFIAKNEAFLGVSERSASAA